MLPFLLIILHFSQIGFTDDLTFTATASLPKKSNCNYSTIFSIWQALFKNSFIIYLYGKRYKRKYAERKFIHLLLQAQTVLNVLPTTPSLPANPQPFYHQRAKEISEKANSQQEEMARHLFLRPSLFPSYSFPLFISPNNSPLRQIIR